MLTARRFTTVPTKDCQERLAAAQSNQRPIARGENHRGAVIAIQSALSDLNQGYLYSGEVDGYFGSRTFAAVEAFQRDYGLVADGIVGKQTLSQLDALFSSDVMRQPLGMSIHIGVDRLDATHYGGEFTLASCVNDARKMKEIAEDIGYDAVILENEDATVANFTGFMRAAIDDLFDGDALLVTFSGHGSQLPNSSNDEEADLLDETLCFYDRMFLDDEFYALLGQFREGVRVHAVFDSCHSGTVAKVIMVSEEKEVYFNSTLGSLKEISTVAVAGPLTEPVTALGSDGGDSMGAEPQSVQPISGKSIGKALEGEKPDFAPAPAPTKELADDVAGLFADLYSDYNTGKAKSIDMFYPIYENNKSLYDAIGNVVGPQENQQLGCSVVTLSACQDSQTTPAGQVYSLFTYNVMSAWNSGAFRGSYSQFHRSLVSVGRADATPALNTYGSSRAEARLYDRPFVF